jgi:hypothetical protein
MHKQWKQVELKIGRFLGGDRIPITGRVRDNTLPDIGKAVHPQKELPDADLYIHHPNYDKILNGWLFDSYNFEIKHRKTLPKWILDLQKNLVKNMSIDYYDRFSLQTLEVFRNFYLTGESFAENEIYTDLELPAWILDAKNQAEMSGKDKQPVVILHGKNQKIKDSLVFTWYK